MQSQTMRPDQSLEGLPKLEELGRIHPEFTPTCDYPGEYINDFHRGLTKLPMDGSCIKYTSNGRLIQGWLRLPDALKLYEMAYFSRGNILELGCYHGLSTSIMARAIVDAKSNVKIHTADLTNDCILVTMDNLRHQRLDQIVRSACDDAAAHVRKELTAGNRFPFAFVDHSHAYQPVYNVCRLLADVITPGGYCCFHDFNDPRNADPTNDAYQVYQAVVDGLDHDCFQFAGIFGCVGMFRRNV